MFSGKRDIYRELVTFPEKSNANFFHLGSLLLITDLRPLNLAKSLNFLKQQNRSILLKNNFVDEEGIHINEPFNYLNRSITFSKLLHFPIVCQKWPIAFQ